MPAVLLNPRLWGALAIAGLLWLGYHRAYSAGAADVQAQWDAAQAKADARALEGVAANAETAVQEVVKYVEKEKLVYRDRPVIRERLVSVCDNPGDSDELRAPASDTGRTDDSTAPVTRDALAGEIPECVSIANRLEALQQLIRKRRVNR